LLPVGLYHVSVHSLAELVLAHVRRQELLRVGDRVGVAVSGGIDSVALLRLLIELRHELGIVLSVVHFNHGLRGAESDADQEFVAGLAREHGLEFYCESGDVKQFAAEEHCGVEAAARELRYGFFRRLLGSNESVEAEGASGANARDYELLDRSAGSAAPPQSTPQGLKPESFARLDGTAEAVPFPMPIRSGHRSVENDLPPQSAPQGLKPGSGVPALRGPEGPLFHGAAASRVQSALTRLDKIVTGHTLDDQAETVLMRIIRGTGLRGLGGIYPRLVVEQGEVEQSGVEQGWGEQTGVEQGGAEHWNGVDHPEIIRPLLGIRRIELEQYLSDLKQPWREDSTNSDTRFTRNRLRSLVLPLLQREFNPALTESLAELAEIARDEEDYWDNEISGWLGTVVQWSAPAWTGEMQDVSFVQIEPAGGGPQQCLPMDFGLRSRIAEAPWLVMNASVSRPWLLTEPRAVQRRVLKAIGEHAGIPLEFKHIEEILRFAAEEGPSGKELSLPLGWKLVREAEALVFVTPDLSRQERVSDYEYSLPVPGRVRLPELGVVIEALRLGPESQIAEYNPQQLLRGDLLPMQLVVRNWRPGDRFWPAHTKAPKKIKELLQERGVTQPERRLWPVVASRDEIVWLRGFPVPARLHAEAGAEAVFIREMPWEVDERIT
jgi:tRNA(Ile)-lysidine synthase